MKTEKALSIVKEICSRHEKCIFDIRRKLDLWDIKPENQEKIIVELIKEKYIDEKRYSGFFVSDKFKLNKWGKIKITYALKEKGIKNDDIISGLEKIEENEYKDTLYNLLSSKDKSIKSENFLQKKFKLIRFGQSRGFEANLIYSVIEQLLENK